MILIDYNAIAISNVVAMKMDPEENMVRHMILNSIRMHRVKNKAHYGEIVICCDGGKNWRKEVFPQYKFKRKDSRKDSKMDWNELFRITNMVQKELKENFPYKVVEVAECEADDIIGVLVEQTQEFGQNEPVMIISGDKDFAQLQKYDNVAQYSPVQKKYIKEDKPRKQLMELVLKGDTSDGVPNVLSGDNVFVDGIRQTPLRKNILEQLINDPKSQGEEIYRNYLRNKKLIDLSETPSPVKKEIIYNYKQQDKLENKSKVFPYLIEKRCRRLLEDVKDFV
jgi:5'-3' exonuclease